MFESVEDGVTGFADYGGDSGYVPKGASGPDISQIYAEVWPIITVDFDGVLNKYNGWKGFYEHFEKSDCAEELLSGLVDRGYTVVIGTARPSWNLYTVIEWLKENNLAGYVWLVTNKKVPSVAYIDDKGMLFTGENAKEILDDLDKGFYAHWASPDNADGPPKGIK